VRLPLENLIAIDTVTPVSSDLAIVVFDFNQFQSSLEALNIALAQSDWVLLVDPTRTTPDAALATLWSHHEEADIVFADELLDHGPLLKTSAVGPHTLLSLNIVGRPALWRSSAVLAAGGIDPSMGRAFEHDLYLRLVESNARFVHVPLIATNGQPANERTHPDLIADTTRVVAAALKRRGVRASVTAERADRVQWRVHLDTPPAVDIVIPTRDRLDLLQRCIDSVVATSTYPNYRITILDNDSCEPATLAYFASSPHRVVPCPGPFNYAAIMNRGVAQCTAPYVLTLNNDTVVHTPDWIEQMVGVATMPGVALVGCRQVDQHGNDEHSGVIIAPYPQHLLAGINWPSDDYLVATRRDISAVTGAVTLIEREAWNAVKGMDETLAVVMNDVDLCLRLQNNGGAVVFLPDVVLRHDASSSRGRLDPLIDRNRFVRRWDIFGSFVDRYFPERLELRGATVVVARPVRDDQRAP